MEVGELLSDGGFWILCGVGFVTYFIMNIILKGMGDANIMSWWIKLIVIIAIPIGSGIFRMLFSSD